ncbi:MAG: sulfurtransferase TusA family protein [Cyanobacteria bacterium P01_C01_bin.120]
MSDAAPNTSDAAAAAAPDDILDLRGTPCPINFVRTKLRLQQMSAGALLEVWIDAGEPVAQVPDSLRIDGYGVEQLIEKERYYALQVRNTQS